jgi:aspartate aminotransferase
LVVDMLNAVPGLASRTPQGAFYVFPSCAGLLGKCRPDGRRLDSDLDVALFLLEEAGVSTVPGTLFGMAPYLRVSIAAEDGVLREGCARIMAACNRLT